MCGMKRRVTVLGIPLAIAAVMVLSGCHPTPLPSGSPSSTAGSSTSATPTPSGSSSAGGAPTCTLDQLSITFSPTDNSAGHAHGVLTFANTSQQTCSITGYSTVVFDNPEAQQAMGAPASHDPSEPTGPAVMTVEGFSTADLTITDAGIVDGCTIVTSIALLVALPGETDYQHVVIPPTQACQNDSIGLLTVSSNYIAPGS